MFSVLLLGRIVVAAVGALSDLPDIGETGTAVGTLHGVLLEVGVHELREQDLVAGDDVSGEVSVVETPYDAFPGLGIGTSDAAGEDAERGPLALQSDDRQTEVDPPLAVPQPYEGNTEHQCHESDDQTRDHHDEIAEYGRFVDGPCYAHREDCDDDVEGHHYLAEFFLCICHFLASGEV